MLPLHILLIIELTIKFTYQQLRDRGDSCYALPELAPPLKSANASASLSYGTNASGSKSGTLSVSRSAKSGQHESVSLSPTISSLGRHGIPDFASYIRSKYPDHVCLTSILL